MRHKYHPATGYKFHSLMGSDNFRESLRRLHQRKLNQDLAKKQAASKVNETSIAQEASAEEIENNVTTIVLTTSNILNVSV